MKRWIMFCTVSIALSFSPEITASETSRLSEEVTVERVLLDVHAINADGFPIAGLMPRDFRVRIGGLEAEVEDADWIGYLDEVPPASDELRTGGVAEGRQRRSGRLIVLFFQTDFARVRAAGQLRMSRHAEELVAMLHPADEVAVVSFDSHLKVRLDFSSERQRIIEAIRASIRIDERPFPVGQKGIVLAVHIDEKDARLAASPERALGLVAEELESTGGPKSLVLFGWGLGRYSRAGVTMTPDYRETRLALERARVAVYALDISQVDYHSLETGLERAAEDTGGFYVETHLFPRFAVNKFHRTISGHYELTLRKPPLSRGVHDLRVSLVQRKGTLLARRSYVEE